MDKLENVLRDALLRVNNLETMWDDSSNSDVKDVRDTGRDIRALNKKRRCSYASSVTGHSDAGFSCYSDSRLSDLEVGKLKRWVAEKNREDRKYNIVIKRTLEKEGDQELTGERE